jgi:cytochrome c553
VISMPTLRTYLRYVLPPVAVLALPLAYTCTPAQTGGGSPAFAESGVRLVAEGNANGAVACARCPGFDGASDGSGAFPILAQQSAAYLNKQLHDYASGARDNAIMSTIAKRLTPQEMYAVSQYYQAQRPDLPLKNTRDQNAVSRGEELAYTGQLSPRVQSCVSCHGPEGRGEPPTVPYLAGQYPSYIRGQLEAYRRGYRVNPQMGVIGHNVSRQDAAAVAAYFGQLSIPNTVTESTHAPAQATSSARRPSKSR